MNSNAFTHLDQPEDRTVYWLGYLLGVGEIVHGKTLRVRVPSDRVDELEALRLFLGTPNTVLDDGKCAMLRVTDRILVSSLIMAGLVPKTTVLDISVPLQLESNPILWRGVVDASGRPASDSSITVRGRGRGSLLKQLVGYVRGLDDTPGEVEVWVTPGGVAEVTFRGTSAALLHAKIAQ